MDSQEALERIKALEEEVAADDVLLKGREQLLVALPECPHHGQCIPYALKWIDRMKRVERLCQEIDSLYIGLWSNG